MNEVVGSLVVCISYNTFAFMLHLKQGLVHIQSLAFGGLPVSLFIQIQPSHTHIELALYLTSQHIMIPLVILYLENATTALLDGVAGKSRCTCGVCLLC